MTDTTQIVDRLAHQSGEGDDRLTVEVNQTGPRIVVRYGEGWPLRRYVVETGPYVTMLLQDFEHRKQQNPDATDRENWLAALDPVFLQ